MGGVDSGMRFQLMLIVRLDNVLALLLCVLGSVASWKSSSALSMVEEAVSNSMLILSYSGYCGFISVGVMFSVVSVSRRK